MELLDSRVKLPNNINEALLKDDYFKDFYLLLPFQFVVINKIISRR